MKRYLFLSILIHAILLSLLYLNTPAKKGDGDKQGGHTGQSDKNIAPKGSPGEMPDTSEIQIKILDSTPKPTTKHPDCLSAWYGGIGVYMDYSGNITKVIPDYPAAVAGIQDGDTIVSKEEITGEPNTPITVMIDRQGHLLTFNLIREKICTN